jgi:methionine sulfoxide reductase heme-binding subunit
MLARAESPLRRLIRPALWLLVLVPAIVLVAQLLLNQLGAEPIESLEHASGEWALRLLAASLAVTPLMRLTGWGWLVAQRRFLGLAAFFWAMGHLSVYIVLDQFFDWPEIVKDVLKHLYITVGMLAFVLMIPLALTSTKSSIRRLGGQRWNQLHRLVYVTAVAGCVHYLWAVKKDIAEPLLYAAVFVVLFVLRLVLRKPGPRPSRPLPPPTPVPSPGS